jgi:hypothetical protein
MNEAMFPFSASCPLPNNIDGLDILPILPIDVLPKSPYDGGDDGRILFAPTMGGITGEYYSPLQATGVLQL